GERARLIADQTSRPTYTVDLAEALLHLLARRTVPVGTLHLANAGRASWHEVGSRALAGYAPELLARFPPQPAALSETDQLGRRPRDSTLCTGRLDGLGYQMPHWEDAMRRFCGRLRESTHADGPLR